jgi:SAM-dependent methyltransferase
LYTNSDYLTQCLQQWPASLALIRAIECRKLACFDLPAPVLDVGCGTGMFAKTLFKNPLAVAIDIDAREVALAARSGAYERTILGDAQDLPFPDASFASVFSNCVLEHIPDLDRALAGIARVLQPGGALLASVPLPEWETAGPFPTLRRWGWHRLSDRLNAILRAAWKHVTLENHDQWQRRLARHGLSLCHWEPYMTPQAYAAHARYLPTACLSLLAWKLLRRPILSRRLRGRIAPILASRLRCAYEAEGSEGACAIFLARRKT